MNSEKKNSWLPIFLISGSLAGWAVFLGIGALWGMTRQSEGADPRKLLIVAATTGFFLLLWALSIWIHSRKRKKAPKNE